jgi:hypothetical protein
MKGSGSKKKIEAETVQSRKKDKDSPPKSTTSKAVSSVVRFLKGEPKVRDHHANGLRIHTDIVVRVLIFNSTPSCGKGYEA